MRIRSFVTAGLAATVLFAVSACSDDSATSDSSAPSTSSSTQSEDEADAQAQAMSVATFQKAVERAQNKKEGRSGHMDASFDMKVAGQSANLTMSSDFASGDGPEDAVMDVSMDVAGQEMQMRLVDQVVYVKGPGMSMSPGKPWVSIDTDDPNNPLGSMFESAGPQSFTEYLSGGKDLKNLGSETIDGVETTHYELTVSTKDLLADNQQLATMAPQSVGMPKELTINVWLNSDQLPVQMKIPFGKVGSFEAHFSDYGKSVQVQAPPANLVSEMGAASL